MATQMVEVLVPADPADPYRYGWRYVKSMQPDGTIVFERVPLTLLDVLHPQEGDQVTHAEAHERRCVYLYDVFSAQLGADPTAVVLHDVLIAWDVPELRPHGPDLAVILGVRERKNWSTFDVAAEGVRPALIVEVTSPETASLDRSTKLEEYDEAGVPLYIIVDTVVRRGQSTLRLLGYRQTPDGYQPLAPDERGRLWLEPVRLWLGIEGGELVCYDEADRPLADYRALAAARAAEHEARVEAERARDEAEQARLEAEQARTEAKRQAAAEAAARTEAEARLRALEAELRRLRGY